MSEFLPNVIVTGEQIKAARALLRQNQQQFSTVCHITVGALRRMERTRGPITLAPNMLKSVMHALTDAGIELIDAGHYSGTGGPGVRLAGEVLATEDVISFKDAADEIAPPRVIKQDAS